MIRALVATDGEDHSVRAERLLTRVAGEDRIEATVFSVTVYDIDPDEPETSSVDVARARTKRVAEEAAERLEKAGFSTSVALAEGDPGAEIVRKVDGGAHDLIVLGAGRSGWTERLLGSTTSYLLHNAPCSVLVVHDFAEKESPLRVIIATDGSEDAENAAVTFARLADPAASEITVVGVAQEDGDSARTHVDTLVAVLGQRGLAATGEVHEGSPAGTLVELAGDRDLVVMGSRGQGAIKRALLGSVSDHVAHNARATLVTQMVV